MKKLLVIVLSVLLVAPYAYAADVSISAQTELASAPAEADILPIYDADPGAGKRITVINLLKALQSALTSFEVHADNLPATDAELAAIAGLTFADASIIQLTGAAGAATLTSGGNNYILGSTSDNSALEFKTPAAMKTLLSVPTVSDTAYDATSWDSNTDAPSKNAVRDKIESLAGGHDAVTLNANVTPTELLTLTGQDIALATQTANYVFAGAVSGGAAAPAFRALVAADIPDISATYQPKDADLTALAAATAANNTIYGINAAGTANFYTSIQIDDSAAQFRDSAAPTKLFQIELAAITAGQTRVLNIADGDTTLVAGTMVTNTAPVFTTSIEAPFLILGSAATAADAGTIRMPNATYIYAEADAAGTDISVIGVDASEVVQIAASGASGVTITPDTTVTGDLTVVGADITLKTDGVKLTAANGALTILGLGDGQDEDIKIDLNTTANTIEITSPASSATTIDINTLNLVATGQLSGRIPVATDADGKTLSGTDLYGSMQMATGAGTWVIPDVDATGGTGQCFCIYSTGAYEIVIDGNAEDKIRLNGTLGAAGGDITNNTAEAAGDYICLVLTDFATDVAHWTTLGYKGTWTVVP